MKIRHSTIFFSAFRIPNSAFRLPSSLYKQMFKCYFRLVQVGGEENIPIGAKPLILTLGAGNGVYQDTTFR
jgi:hypothetical protein